MTNSAIHVSSCWGLVGHVTRSQSRINQTTIPLSLYTRFIRITVTFTFVRDQPAAGDLRE